MAFSCGLNGGAYVEVAEGYYAAAVGGPEG